MDAPPDPAEDDKPARYARAWKDYGRRSLLAGSLVVVFIGLILLSFFDGWAHRISVLAAIPIGVAGAIAHTWLNMFDCPRCRKSFNGWFSRNSGFGANTCRSCGLPKGYAPLRRLT